MPAKHHYRRDVLPRPFPEAVGSSAVSGRFPSRMAGMRKLMTWGAATFGLRVRTGEDTNVLSLAKTQKPQSKAGASPSSMTRDVLGHRSPGDGGGFRGTVLASSGIPASGARE